MKAMLDIFLVLGVPWQTGANVNVPEDTPPPSESISGLVPIEQGSEAR